MNRTLALFLPVAVCATIVYSVGGDTPSTGGSAAPHAEDGAPATAWVGPTRWTVLNPGVQRGGCALNVAVLGAGTTAQIDDVIASLTGDPRIATITGFALSTATPTLAELEAFDSVLVFTNTTPQSSVALGDVLADYVDAGGGVVLTMFAIRASMGSRTVEGRFLTSNYYCINRTIGGATTGSATLGTIFVPTSRLLQGVESFDGGSQSFRSPANLNQNATRLVDWSTGQVLAAERTDLPGGRVDLGFFAVSDSASGGSWLPTSDGAQLLRNAVVMASRCVPPCPGDLDNDGAVGLSDLTTLLANFGNVCR